VHKIWTKKPLYWIFTVSWLLPSITACTNPDKKKLARVDGTVITATEVETALGRALSQLHQQIYNLQRQKLSELIEERLLSEEAKRRGLSVPELLEQEVIAKILPVADDEIAALYAANKARIPVELDTVREQIRDVLREQRRKTQETLFVQSLRAKAKIVTYLTPPAVFRAEVFVNGAPFKGSEKAVVTIVKFEDFHCPYCKAVQPNYEEVLKRYDGKVRLVHKDLPLDQIHPQARQAAEAARCADDEGKFWQYHDKLYASAPKATPEDLKSYAKEVGLNENSFEKCLGTGKYKGRVQKDVDEGTGLGLTGTPTFFINGRELSGAQSVEAIAQIIDEELARTN
jgi:protein-disulfide isomerase/copper chaperone CopZ